MLAVADLCRYVIMPVCASLPFDTPAALDLMLGTALAESGLVRLEQEGGPALGLWQMEPATHDDIWINYFPHERAVMDAVVKSVAGNPVPEKMTWNLRYACAMARCEYLRSPEPIPAAVEAQAAYWVTWYNRGGMGTVDHYLDAWDAMLASQGEIHA